MASITGISPEDHLSNPHQYAGNNGNLLDVYTNGNKFQCHTNEIGTAENEFISDENNNSSFITRDDDDYANINSSDSEGDEITQDDPSPSVLNTAASGDGNINSAETNTSPRNSNIGGTSGRTIFTWLYSPTGHVKQHEQQREMRASRYATKVVFYDEQAFNYQPTRSNTSLNIYRVTNTDNSLSSPPLVVQQQPALEHANSSAASTSDDISRLENHSIVAISDNLSIDELLNLPPSEETISNINETSLSLNGYYYSVILGFGILGFAGFLLIKWSRGRKGFESEESSEIISAIGGLTPQISGNIIRKASSKIIRGSSKIIRRASGVVSTLVNNIYSSSGRAPENESTSENEVLDFGDDDL